MPYEGAAEFPRLFRRTLRETFVSSGRSTRSEFGVYYVAVAIAFAAIQFAVPLVNDHEWSKVIDEGIWLVLCFPFIALLARRAHDQDRSGWCVLLPIAIFGYSTVLRYLAQVKGIEARIALEHKLWPLNWLGPVVGIGFLFLFFRDGTIGPNRFGPDPRGRE